MAKRLTILLAVEEYELYDLYKDIIESYGEDLKDPSLVSDLYDLIDEYEEEFDFSPDSDGDYSESFERNLKEAINTIVEESDDLIFVDRGYPDNDDILEIYDDEFDDDDQSLRADSDDEDIDDY